MDQIQDINIQDESTSTEKRFQFYIGNHRRGLVTQGRDGWVKLHWQTSGPSQLGEARVWIQGLLELLMIAEQLNAETDHGKKKSQRRKR